MLKSDHETPTPTNPTRYPLRSRVHAVIPRGLSPHRLYCRRHGGEWPSFDHASFRGMDIAPLLLLLHNQPLRGVRVNMSRDFTYPLLLNAPRVPAVILLPRGLSCCCKLPAHDHAPAVGLLVFSLPTATLPPQDLGLHCTLPTAVLPPKNF